MGRMLVICKRMYAQKLSVKEIAGWINAALHSKQILDFARYRPAALKLFSWRPHHTAGSLLIDMRVIAMSPFSLRTSTFPRLLLPLLAGMLALAATRNAPQAAEAKAAAARTYVMPADDGYGLTECLAQGGSCARIVADAWCEAHGHARAISFGSADDLTASIGEAVGRSADKGSYIVTCAE